MGIVYNIYANDGLGGAVNYAAPIATTGALTYTPGPLPRASDTTFAVRASDTATGLEESNTEARVRIILDSNGQDISSRPNAPNHLAVRATAGGGCLATWGYNPVGQGGAPSAFLVYLTRGAVPSYSDPAATVPFLAGTARFSCALAGLADAATYAVAVRASNLTATEGGTSAVALVTGDSTPPNNVDTLAGVATFASR